MKLICGLKKCANKLVVLLMATTFLGSSSFTYSLNNSLIDCKLEDFGVAGVVNTNARDTTKVNTFEDLLTLIFEVNEGNDFKGKVLEVTGDICIGRGAKAGELSQPAELIWKSIGYFEENPYTGEAAEISKPFNGIIEGNGHTIYFDLEDVVGGENFFGKKGPTGLFGFVGESGVIKNLNFEGKLGGENSELSKTAVICGYNLGTIQNCKVKAELEGKHNLSGICFENNGIIENCGFDGEIKCGDLLCAGICGKNCKTISGCKVDATIVNCYNGGLKNNFWTQMPETAGICAFNYGEVLSCEVEGIVKINNLNGETTYQDCVKMKNENKDWYPGTAGGIVSTNNGVIKDSNFDGIICAYEAGGIIGVNYETILNCKAYGKFSGFATGGIAGTNLKGDKKFKSEFAKGNPAGYIESCYFHGNLSSLGPVGEVFSNQNESWSSKRMAKRSKGDANIYNVERLKFAVL